MKLSQIALAVAVLAAGSANATNLAPQLVINLDGATATAQTVADVSAYMCQTGTAVTYTNTATATAAAGKIKAVFCPVSNAKSGLTEGKTVFVSKNNVDGSLESLERALMRKTVSGGVPLNSNANGYTEELDPTNCNTTAKTCGTVMAPAIGGFSDVNASVWQDRSAFNPALVSGGYTAYPGIAAQGFGLAVTGELYKALQAAQGLTVGVPANGYTMTATELANQPNLTRAQFASILGGYYATDWSPIVGSAGTGMNVNLCRRNDNSGTQASMDSFFMNFPCSKSASASVHASDSGDTLKVIQNAGTGDVKTCLSSRNVAGNVNSFAVGVMSSENKWSSTGYSAGPEGWFYVKLDGVSMNEDTTQRKATTEGRYAFMEETSAVVRNDASSDIQTYMGNFFTAFGSPSAVTPLVGISAVPGTYLWDPLDSNNIRVDRSTRGGDACAPALLVN